VGEGRNGEGQGKFNGKLDVVSERTGRGTAKCVAREKKETSTKEKREEKERKRFRSVEVCL